MENGRDLLFQVTGWYSFTDRTDKRKDNPNPEDIPHPKDLGWQAKVAPLELIEWKE